MNKHRISHLMLSVLLLLPTSALSAVSPITLTDIGVFGLASHDLFAWDSKNKSNTENGRLDLSTIFDYDSGNKILSGGNPKNGENAPVYTVTNFLLQYFLSLETNLSGIPDYTHARKQTVLLFLEMVRTAYFHITGMRFPLVGFNDHVTTEEQAAMRAIHDILPGTMVLNPLHGKTQEVNVTDMAFSAILLTPRDLIQTIPYFDGLYHSNYLAIETPRGLVNLKKADEDFIATSTHLDLSAMLSELKEVGEGKKKFSDTSFAGYIHSLFAKGVCNANNLWLPADIPCSEGK